IVQLLLAGRGGSRVSGLLSEQSSPRCQYAASGQRRKRACHCFTFLRLEAGNPGLITLKRVTPDCLPPQLVGPSPWTTPDALVRLACAPSLGLFRPARAYSNSPGLLKMLIILAVFPTATPRPAVPGKQANNVAAGENGSRVVAVAIQIAPAIRRQYLI